MRYIYRFLLGLAFIAPGLASAHEAPKAMTEKHSCARYLGNEGVSVASGETKILFDAFYADSYGQYALVPEETRKALMEGRAPYDGVDALFVSHVHGDHFSPAPTLAYLQAQPNVTLYASGQVIDALKEAGAGEDLAARMKAFDLDVGQDAQALEVGDLSIDVVRIPHAGGAGRANIENLAFRVTLNGELTVLHMGDADPADHFFEPHQDHWDAKPLDVAFPPYWFFGGDEGRSIVEDRLKAKQAIGVHVPIAAAEQSDAWKAQYNADLFTTPGETRALSDGKCK